MPKAPITAREGYFAKIRGSVQPDGTPQIARIPWNVVSTELGPMVEPAPNFGGAASNITNIDGNDAAFTAVRVLDDEGQFQATFGTGGAQLPVEYNA